MEYPLENLEIIGCREIPGEPFLPRFLTPVFAVRGTDTVLLPPYILADTTVVDPVVTNQAEFEDLCVRGRIKARDPVPAKPAHELYLHPDGGICYAGRVWAAKEMERWHNEHFTAAEEAFLARNFPKAILDASIARSANPQSLVDTLILQAAAERSAGRKDEAMLSREFARKRISKDSFDASVERWMKKLPSAVSKLSGIAKRHSPIQCAMI